MEQKSQFQPQEAICRVCGTTIGDSPQVCPDCLTPHHHDCWEYNGGCATYACPSGHHKPRPVPATTEAQSQLDKPVDKIPFPSLQAGTFMGFFFVTNATVAVTLYAEVMAITRYNRAPDVANFWFIVMILAICWAAVTAEVFNIDIKNNCITRSKLLLGQEIFEWKVCSLDEVDSIQLVRCVIDDEPKRKLICRLKEKKVLYGQTIDLTPAYSPGSPDDFAIDELLYRIESGSPIKVEIAQSLRRLREEGTLEEPEVQMVEENKEAKEPEM